MIRISLLGLLFLASASGAEGPIMVAEKARLSAGRGETDAGPALIRSLKEADGFALRNALLDALIRLDVSVQASLLAPLFAEHPDEVIILLAVNPKANRETLLKLMDGRPSIMHWMAMADILAAAKQPGVAARVFARLRIDATIEVFPGQMVIGLDGGWERRPKTKIRAQHRVGWFWPPLVRYSIVEQPVRGDVYLAGRQHRIYYRREEFESGRVEYPEVRPKTSLAEFCLRNLSEHLGYDWRDLDINPEPSLWHEWEGAEKFLKEANQHREKLERGINFLLDRLVRENALTENERKSLKPTIRWTVEDKSKGGARLPIPPWPPKR